MGRGTREVSIVKNGGDAQMAIVLTTEERSHLVVGVFDDLLGPLSYIYL